VIRRVSPGSRLIALERNLGFGPANNLGVERAETDVVVLLNPDTLIVDDSLARLAELAARERALFGSRLLNEDMTRQISAFPAVAGWESALISIWPGALMPRALRRRCEPWRWDERVRVGWLSGACLVARRQLLAEFGPFDEQLPLYGEDSDLGLRAARRGVASIFAPDVARVVHLGSRSGAQKFDDVGTRRKLESRRWIVRNRFGPGRAGFDLAMQFALYGLRWLAKTALRRDGSIERIWLRAAVASIWTPAAPRRPEEG
jgi:GT2 family glycosyltransferase